jgi:hypothetical protein
VNIVYRSAPVPTLTYSNKCYLGQCGCYCKIQNEVAQTLNYQVYSFRKIHTQSVFPMPDEH